MAWTSGRLAMGGAMVVARTAVRKQRAPTREVCGSQLSAVAVVALVLFFRCRKGGIA